MFQLRAELRELQPPIWRRLAVSDQTSLAGLHRILQVAFGWQDYHQHQFEGPKGRLSGRSTLAEVLSRPGDRILYEYDFGDGWQHDIALEASLDAPAPAPACLAGERSAPPEDSGGVPGYENLLQVLGDPTHPEHADMREWAGDFDPERFDLAAINLRLASLRSRG